MANMAFKKKMTKREFITKLIDDFGIDNLSESPYSENGMDEYGNPKITKLTLYYFKGVHAATWCNGEGWIFQSAYDAKEAM